MPLCGRTVIAGGQGEFAWVLHCLGVALVSCLGARECVRGWCSVWVYRQYLGVESVYVDRIVCDWCSTRASCSSFCCICCRYCQFAVSVEEVCALYIIRRETMSPCYSLLLCIYVFLIYSFVRYMIM